MNRTAEVTRNTAETKITVALDLDGVRRASARFAGVVVETRKSLGDKVAAGEVVARVENSQTLVSAEVKAPGAGVVIARTAAAGEAVAEGAALYTIAALDKVWVELEIPRKDLGRVQAGQAVGRRIGIDAQCPELAYQDLAVDRMVVDDQKPIGNISV